MSLINTRRENKKILIEKTIELLGKNQISVDLRNEWVECLLMGIPYKMVIDAIKNDLTPKLFIVSLNENPYFELNPSEWITSENIKTNGTLDLLDDDIKMSTGETRDIFFAVENNSNFVWINCNDTPMAFSYHLYNANDEVINFNGDCTDIVQPLSPGEKSNYYITFTAPSGIGEYKIEVTLVMHGKFWFEEKGLKTKKISLKVLAPNQSNYTRIEYLRLTNILK